MLNFKVACAQKFQTKNSFLAMPAKYGMLFLICKRFIEKMIRRKYRRTTPKNPVFSVNGTDKYTIST